MKQNQLEVKSGADLISEERQRQIESEGYSANHDDKFEQFDQLSHAAVCYALSPTLRRSNTFRSKLATFAFKECPNLWPWDIQYWKPTPHDRVRELVKAGALIAAEIDRLQRLTA